jgi:hypothetical protein
LLFLLPGWKSPPPLFPQFAPSQLNIPDQLLLLREAQCWQTLTTSFQHPCLPGTIVPPKYVPYPFICLLFSVSPCISPFCAARTEYHRLGQF